MICYLHGDGLYFSNAPGIIANNASQSHFNSMWGGSNGVGGCVRVYGSTHASNYQGWLLDGGTLLGDYAPGDCTLKGTTALAAAAVNVNGGDILIYAGDHATGGSAEGSVKICEANGSTAIATFDQTDITVEKGINSASHYYCVSFTIPDEPDDDAQHFQIEIDDDMDFSSVIIDHDSRDGGDGGDGQTGCAYFNGTQWAAWTSGNGVVAAFEGERGAYAFQSSSIYRGTVYYVRIRFHDGTAWGDYMGELKTW